ncbi:aspartyl/glutamyl-tRNA amidotransferase subunit A [Candidatus Peribacteria bacterium RIFOXYC1_FULL_54_13]|nr:MAG: aspartyl/glutamyl-tRNA amidotransferase subunit A [Candidatus Peribacteria bacterium RIFOXYA1_FULL_56_14]OGJ73391.1 MAG: aspartyl/glutamyl-tRNA amidotransferase subunit A [Candidatus Peribacteria bacterium RIFOXYA2_FULL_55_28]OGJ74573.1 MAG: aspartyl/glutamyl-tRNA amidotransferase subunit A [Candidatus Peribacteria bacterium RIFOXYB1_FULL_54_35]OGJ77619.1 MAG: aspartyl/glutamyl-tRNA amidotransferase subunit A [Candidatus Peribacteria bacterium RIFOXYB2_FULL_54_17]OGJ78734.1 MAG: asparty
MAPNTLTIAEAHEQLKGKKISSAELTQACIDRIEKVDGTLNATVFRNFERALEEAKKIDTKGEFTHPLSGIPYLTKDVFCEKGVPTTGCSNVLRRKDYIPAFDSTTTKRLKAAGALSLGKTNTDEFTMGASTETSCYGVTRCPWDTKRVAGGSSGGSAAATAADECLFALGTDTGGSIRQPANFCGCTGLRVTYGRTSRYGVMSMASSLDTIGPLCKSIEDIAIVLETIAGKDPLDATTSDVPVPHYRQALSGSIKGMKLGMPKEYFIKGMHKDTEAAVRDTTKVFESAGATVEEISLPHTEYAVPTYYIICPSEVSSNMARYDGIRYGHTTGDAKDLIDYYHRVRTEGFGNEVKRRIMIGTYALSAGYYDAYYRQAQKVRTLIKRDFDEAFRKVDAIIAPVSPTPAFTVGTHENDPVAMYLEDVFSVSQAMAGIPALSVPCGFSKSVTPGFVEGLPIGLQIMGPQWQEERILKIAYAYEQAAEWHERKPKL